MPAQPSSNPDQFIQGPPVLSVRGVLATARYFRDAFQRILLLGVVLAFSAQGASLETGWLKDEKGSFDPKSGAKVASVANMDGQEDEKGQMKWKSRYVAVEIPTPKLDAKKLVILGPDGKMIKHSHPETHAWGSSATYVKLFFDRPAGFSFRLSFSE